MPTASNEGTALYYEAVGQGEAVVFVADAGFGAWAWGWQAPALANGYEVIVMNNRGTGQSDAPPGPYNVSAMAADLEAVLADHGTRSAVVVGAGLGGMIALTYALDYSRADRIAVFGTPGNGAGMAARAFVGKPEALDVILSAEFMDAYPGVAERIIAWREREDATGPAAAAHIAAVESFDRTDDLVHLSRPVLVAHGAADAVVPIKEGQALNEAIPHGRFDSFENGSHLFYIEQSRLVTDALIGFIESTG